MLKHEQLFLIQVKITVNNDAVLEELAMDQAITVRPVLSIWQWRDYWILSKPNVVLLMVLTSSIGMFLSVPHWVSWDVLVFGNLGIALCAASAAAINHIVDQQIDQRMQRTANRPLATQRLSNQQAIAFVVLTGSLGMALLRIFTNELTLWLTFAALMGYAFFYTVFLKRTTPQNIVIGGLAGAAPPLLGWTAVTNTIDPNALLLVLIIFAWTPPHFWALAIHRKDEYAKAGLPMLPVTHGVKYTSLHCIFYTVILLAVSVMPFATQMFGWIYFVSAMLLGIWLLKLAVDLYRDVAGSAMRMFGFSITYLMLLFLAMLVDHSLSLVSL